MSSFLEELAREVCRGQQDLEDFLFILPSKRAGNYLKSCLAKEMGKTLFAPQVYSIEAFIQEISGMTNCPRVSLLFNLYEAYLEITPEDPESYESFVQWGSTLLQDFMEIDRYLIPPARVFSYLSAIQEMNHWSVSSEKSTMVRNYLNFWERLHPLYERFSSRLLESGEGHQGLLYKRAVEKLPAYLETHGKKRYVFAGFNALNQAESNIIQSILREAKADIYWDTDLYFIEDQIHDAGFFMREYFSKWPYYATRDPKGPAANFLRHKEIRIVGVPRVVSQAKFVGKILMDLHKNDPKALDNTALILGDENLLNPILNALPSEITPLNITMGYPLGETTMAGFFLQWMDLFISEDRSGWYFQYFLEFLSHPVIQNLLTDTSGNEVARIRETLIAKNSLYVNFEALGKLDLRNHHNLKILFSGKKTPQKFLKDGLSLLKQLYERQKENEEPISLQENQLMEQVLTELKAVLEMYPYVYNIRALKGLFQDLLAARNLDFVGDPARGLQIMGMLESRNLDFHTVIITSVNEGILPAGKSINSFIPFDVKRELGLPTYKEKDAVYTYHFYRLIQRAKKVILCYNTEPDVLEGGEKSRLIYQLTTDPGLKPFITEELATPKVPLKGMLPLSVAKDDWVMNKIQILGKKGFSPTALTDYIRDPLVFFKRHILNMEDSDGVEASLEARTFGTIVHQALEILFEPFLGQILTPEALKEQHKKIRSLVHTLVLKLYPDQRNLEGKNLIASEVIIKYLQRFLELEIEQSRQHHIRLMALEQKFHYEYPISGLPYKTALKGTVDRIDEMDGQIRILDYKTGSVKTAEVEIVDWDTLIQDKNKGKALQLLCYALLYTWENPMENVLAGIIPIKAPKTGPFMFATKERSTSRTKTAGVTAAILREFEAQLQILIREICDPKTPFTEKPD